MPSNWVHTRLIRQDVLLFDFVYHHWLTIIEQIKKSSKKSTDKNSNHEGNSCVRCVILGYSVHHACMHSFQLKWKEMICCHCLQMPNTLCNMCKWERRGSDEKTNMTHTHTRRIQMQLSFDNKNGNRITVYMFTQMMNGNIDYYMRYLLTSFQKKNLHLKQTCS